MPLLITQEQYDHAMSVIHGEEEMLPFFQDLRDRIKQEYNIKAIDFFIEEENSGPESKKRIHMLINKYMDYQHTRFRKKLDRINQKMQELCDAHHFMSLDELDPYIGFYNFRPIYEAECVNLASKQAIPLLKKKYSSNNISDIIYSGFGSVTVFYTLKTDAENNRMKGINDKIKEDFYTILKPFDEFKTIKYEESYITFDSKEFLDSGYNGNLWQYYK
jgi:hypothetical protein